MNTPSKIAECSPTKRRIATALGVITLLCASLFVLSMAFMTAQAVGGVYDGPILGLAVFVLTLPIAIICTSFALYLVGPRQCKLAWISFCVVYSPLILCALIGICAAIVRRIFSL